MYSLADFALHSTIGIALICALGTFAPAASGSGIEAPDESITTVTKTMNYQGILKDSAGDPVADGDYDMTFRIYENESGGSAIWAETQIVNTSNGYFRAELGSTNPIDLPFDSNYYFTIQISGDAEMSGRQKITMTPYAARSESSDQSSKPTCSTV